MANIEKRIEALEAAFAQKPPADSAAGARERLVREFNSRALNAMASIKRAPINPEQYRYSIEKLRGASPIVVAAHVAVLAALEHEDEDEARVILADLERERDLDPALHEKLLEMIARLTEAAHKSREDAV